jgi:hypothetical protein
VSILKQPFLVFGSEGAASQVKKENLPTQKQKSENKKGF